MCWVFLSNKSSNGHGVLNVENFMITHCCELTNERKMQNEILNVYWNVCVVDNFSVLITYFFKNDISRYHYSSIIFSHKFRTLAFFIVPQKGTFNSVMIQFALVVFLD